jgi:hypothetical protein
LTLNGLQAGDAGNYTLVLSNSFGTNISVAAALTVFSGPITNSLVVHLKFDGDYKDVSGSGLDGAAVGTPTFQPGILGQAVHLSSSGTPANNPDTNNYVTLGTQLKLSTNDFSVSLWAKSPSKTTTNPLLQIRIGAPAATRVGSSQPRAADEVEHSGRPVSSA